MTFDSPFLLALGPALALLIGGLAWRVRRARLRATAVWAPGLGGGGRLGGRGGPWLLAAAGALAGVGAAGPRWGRSEIELEGRALNLAIGMDISRSMLAEDAVPNRLQRAIREAGRLVQDTRGDRLALLAFAGRSYILTPLTLDDGAVSLQLDALDPDIASDGGTALADLLQQSRGLLAAAVEGGARALVVFTDGETHDSVDAALAAARALRADGVTLILAAEGDSVPVRIPLRDPRGALLGYKPDAEGRTVFTRRGDAVLRAVVDAAAGVLVRAESPDQEGEIRRVLDGLERTAARERRREDLTPRGWLFALGAVALLALQGLRRRGPALAVLVLSLAGSRTGLAQRPSLGDRLLRRGDTAAAAQAFGLEAARRAGADTALFNAGTAALARGDHPAARDWLVRASRSLDPGLRFRALYNLGLVDVMAARRDTAKRQELHDRAAQRFREALLIAPSSPEAKWNLELVQSPAPPPSSGGGRKPPPTPPRQGMPPPSPTPGGSALSQAEADQILKSVDRSERDVRADQARRRRVAVSSAGKDW